MRRIISQIMLIVAFIFLAIFSMIWFDNSPDGSGDDVDKSKSVLIFVEAVQKTWQTINYFTTMSSPLLIDAEDSVTEVSDLSNSATKILNGADNLVSGLESGAEAIDSELNSDTNFSEFLKNFFIKAPALYFDTKVYSNGWRDFWSLGWLEDQDFSSEV